jgi:hypothetical protein
MTPEVGQALFAAIAAIEVRGLRHAVVGGLALGGEMRAAPVTSGR